MNFDGYWKAESSPGEDWNPPGAASRQPSTLTFSKFNTQKILNDLQKLKVIIARSAGKGILLKR